MKLVGFSFVYKNLGSISMEVRAFFVWRGGGFSLVVCLQHP